MRLQDVAILVVLAATFLVYGSADTAILDSEQAKVSADSPSSGRLSTAGQDVGTRFLRVKGPDSSTSMTEEERGAVIKAMGQVVSAVKMKAKMKLWLTRRVVPAKVYKSLKITGDGDKKMNAYKRYYFKFMVKYPKKQPTDLPEATFNAIMKARLTAWLGKKLFPQQVLTELNKLGPDYIKYLQEYLKMWGAKQAMLSQRAAAKLGI